MFAALPFTRPKTVAALARRLESRFKRAGLAYGQGGITPGDDAVFIILEAMGLPPDSFTENWNTAIPPEGYEKIMVLAAARIQTRKPAAYLLHKAYLHGYAFYVDERTIIPRSFIAEILCHEDGFGPLERLEKIERVLDLCTGSGCLAIIAAHLFPEAEIDAVDLSADALAVARQNVDAHNLTGRVNLFQGDLFSPLAGKKYDLILTNPPYVDAAGMADLPPEYRHEPAMALGSGADGLDIIRRLMKDAAGHLNPGGAMLCEIGRGKALVEQAWPQTPFLWLDTVASSGEVFWLARKDWPQ